MRIRLPLSGAGTETSLEAPASNRLRLRLPFGLGGGGGFLTAGSSREERAFRAVAAAAALADDAAAVGLAKQVEDDPLAVFAQIVNVNDITPVLKAVSRYLDDTTGAPGPNQKERDVATAAGAGPALVAAAYRAMLDAAGAVTPQRAEAARLWVAQAGRGPVLDVAGRAASRITNPQLPNRAQTIAKLSDDVAALRVDVQGVNNDVAGLDGRVQVNSTNVTANTKGVTTLGGQVANLDTRVTRLEELGPRKK